MKNSIVFLSALSLGTALACACGPANDSTTGLRAASAEEPAAPSLPSESLAVPAGNELAFSFDAIGVQIYDCTATAIGYAWVFRAPDATLYQNDRPRAIHYAGPTWESLQDGSKVVAAKVAGYTVDATAVPWLLLHATSHAGYGRMARVSYVQRLDTVGGIAPSSTCDATTNGSSAAVPYTATYCFYAPDAD